MLWGEGFGGACCFPDLRLLGAGTTSLWIFRALMGMCQSSLVPLSHTWGAVTDPRIGGIQLVWDAQEQHRELGTCSQEHREAEDGAWIL